MSKALGLVKMVEIKFVCVVMFLIFPFTESRGEMRSFDLIEANEITGGSTISGIEPALLEKVKIIAEKDAGEYVKNTLNRLSEKWSSGQIGELISGKFYNREGFLSSLIGQVPKDAVLRIVAIKNMKIFPKKIIRTNANPAEVAYEALVSVTLTTQIEFNDNQGKFQKVEGENEFVFEVNLNYSL